MKRLMQFLIIIFISSSCSESFIDLVPESQMDSKSFYQTEDDMILAVNACYSGLTLQGVYNTDFLTFSTVRSDEARSWGARASDPDYGGFQYFNLALNNPFIESIWTDHYKAVLRCNIVVNNIDNVEMDESDCNQLKGEAQFIRALLYFNLVRSFGAVPLVLEEITNPEDAYDVDRTPVDTVYNQIFKDLIFARDNLPAVYSASDIGRATSGAASGILARAYLQQAGTTYANDSLAKAELQYIIDSEAGYGLLGDFSDLWSYDGLDNKNSKESIFEIQFLASEGTYSRLSSAFSNYSYGPGSETGTNQPTRKIALAWEDGDERKDPSMVIDEYNYTTPSEKDMVTMKWYDMNQVEAFQGEMNYMVMRYSDVLLLMAEILNRERFPHADAFEYLNQVRNRAGLTSRSYRNDLDTYDKFVLAVEDERFMEFSNEGCRWWDLIRTGRAVEVMNEYLNYDYGSGSDNNEGTTITIDETKYLLPIPSTVYNANPEKMYQNPGY